MFRIDYCYGSRTNNQFIRLPYKYSAPCFFSLKCIKMRLVTDRAVITTPRKTTTPKGQRGEVTEKSKIDWKW